MLDMALRYVRNCSGSATTAEFVEDHGPTGENLWQCLLDGGYAAEDEAGRIQLTAAGARRLEQPPTPGAAL